MSGNHWVRSDLLWLERKREDVKLTYRWISGCVVILSLCFPGSTRADSDGQNRQVLVGEYLQELDRGVEYRRIIALEKLRQISSSEAIAGIIRTMLHDRSKPVRRAAQQQLADFEDPRIAISILQGLKDPDRRVRLAAIDVAGLLRDPQTAVYLADTADAAPTDTEVALRVLEALRELVYRQEPPPGFEARLTPWLSNRNIKLKQRAVLILAILGRPDSLPQLMPLWNQADRKTRIHLADAFANINRIEPSSLLVKALAERDNDLLMHALYALAQIQSFATLPTIQALLLQNRDERVRMACLYALIEIPDATSIPFVLQIMSENNPTVLHWAIYALSQLHASTAGGVIISKLSNADSMVRATAATALGELRTAEALAPLLALIKNPKEAAEVKVAAAKSLMQLGNPAGNAVIQTALLDSQLDFSARLTYAMALASMSDQVVLAQMKRDLKASDFVRVFTAALVLGLKGDVAGKDRLLSSLDHAFPQIRQFSVMGLEAIADAEVNRALAQLANDDPDPIVRILAAACLVRQGQDDYRVILWNSLETPKEDIRSEAIIALGHSASLEVLQQLKWYLKREPSIPVRQTIQRVIRDRTQ